MSTPVPVVTTDQYEGVPAHQLDILRRMEVHAATASEKGVAEGLPDADLVIDAIIGYSLSGSPHGTAAALIEWANAQSAPVLSLDAPSGVDTMAGTVREPAIHATATMTLALPKSELGTPEARAVTGDLYAADISVPPGLYASETLGMQVGPLFAQADIIPVAYASIQSGAGHD